jgi:L-ascorbate metabolism protein UlaG (beta-lactamase superfamily)
VKRIALAIGVLFMTNTLNATESSIKVDGKFQNQEISYDTKLSQLWDMTKMYAKAKRKEPAPTKEVPLLSVSREQLDSINTDSVFRLGHSTMLMKVDGKTIMADPVMSERASPVQWAGPKRFHPNPIDIDALPVIDVVIISHDHYDHLDRPALNKLDSKVTQYIVPLGVGQRMINWGVDADKVTELDWWQEHQVDGINFAATPTQHFSGRGLFDKDSTLWAGWVIQGQNSNLYFSGDSGYFGGFKAVGEKYGPFDITMIETGAYNDMWKEIHMLPEESVQAHIDLKGKAMIPIHNGTFDLALHDWYEPFERAQSAAIQHDVQLLTPKFGEQVEIQSPGIYSAWWREVSETEDLKLTAASAQ